MFQTIFCLQMQMSYATELCSFTRDEPWTKENIIPAAGRGRKRICPPILFSSSELWNVRWVPTRRFQSRWSVRVRNGHVHMHYFCTIYSCAWGNVDGVIRSSSVGLQEGGAKGDQYRIMFLFLAQCYGLIRGYQSFVGISCLHVQKVILVYGDNTFLWISGTAR